MVGRGEIIPVLRQLGRSKVETIVVVLVLALAISIPVTVFAIVDGVLFRALPFRTPTELFALTLEAPGESDDASLLASWNEVNRWKQTESDLALAAVSPTTTLWYQTPERDYWMASADESLFDVLGTGPLLGGFAAEDFEWSPAAAPNETIWPVLITAELWRSRFGESSDVLGQTVLVSEREGRRFGYRVAGVLQDDFVFPLIGDTPQPTFITPFPKIVKRGNTRQLALILRLPPDITPRAAEGVLMSALAGIVRPPTQHGDNARELQRIIVGPERIALESLALAMTKDARPTYWLAVAVASGLFALMLANVVGLWVARGNQQRDLAVRRALGAQEADVVRLQLVRALALAFFALAPAAVLTPVLLRLTTDMLPSSLPLLKVPVVGVREVIVSVGVALGAAAAIAIGTTLFGDRRPLHALPGSAGQARSATAETLTILQVAIAVCLVAAAVMAGREWAAAWFSSPGYETSKRVFVDARANGYRDIGEASEQLMSAYSRLESRFGSGQVAASSLQPTFGPGNPWTNLMPAGKTEPVDGTTVRHVTANFFQVLGLQVVAGSLPGPALWTGTSPVAVVSQRAARLMWPEREAIGQQVISRNPDALVPSYTVVAVVADARFRSLDDQALGDVYVPDPFQVGFMAAMYFLPGTDTEVPTAQNVVKQSGLHVVRASTIDAALFSALKHRALPAWLLGIVAVVGVPVLGLGLLASASATARLRRAELAVRWALGANSPGLVLLLMRRQVLLVTTGVMVGAVAAFALLRGSGRFAVETDKALLLPVFVGVAIVSSVALASAALPTVVRAFRPRVMDLRGDV